MGGANMKNKKDYMLYLVGRTPSKKAPTLVKGYVAVASFVIACVLMFLSTKI